VEVKKEVLEMKRAKYTSARRFMSDFSNSLLYRSLYPFIVMTFMNLFSLAILRFSYASAFVGLAVD
jgi:hypothetical protein